MAATTKPEINKSQSIRDFLKKNPKVHAKEVVAGLAAKGITVTESHVYVVKGKMKEKKLQKAKDKKAAKEKAVASEPVAVKKLTPPAAPASTNKSQAVRDLLQANPRLTVDEVIRTLAGLGLNVKKGLVYMVKGKMKPRKRTTTKGKTTDAVTTTAVASNNDGAGDALKTIKQIKSLAAELGGIKKLKALVDALTE